MLSSPGSEGLSCPTSSSACTASSTRRATSSLRESTASRSQNRNEELTTPHPQKPPALPLARQPRRGRAVPALPRVRRRLSRRHRHCAPRPQGVLGGGAQGKSREFGCGTRTVRNGAAGGPAQVASALQYNDNYARSIAVLSLANKRSEAVPLPRRSQRGRPSRLLRDFATLAGARDMA